MAFPTNLKDEIKADGVTAKQYVEIDVTSGASLNGGKPIVLKRYDKPKQQGSVLNAKMVNAIHQRLNELDGAVVTTNNTTKLGGVLNIGANVKLQEGANQSLYQEVNGVWHQNLHTGNINNVAINNAYISDKVRTFDMTNTWHDDRLFYVHEIADGVYQPYVQEPSRACPIKTKYTENADSLQGYYPLHVVGTYNPVGNDWVVVPCFGRDVQYVSILNGNWDACPIRWNSAARQGDHLLVFFERAFTGNIQLNIRMFYPGV